MTSKNLAKNSVSLSKGSLVLSLPAAVEPVVWRMDLKQAQAASFTVKEEKSGKWALIKKGQNNDEAQIAVFETKDSAMDILMGVSDTLQAGKTSGAPPQATSASAQSELMKWGIAIGGVLIVVGLFLYLASISPETADPFAQTTAGAPLASGSPDATGVPVSADDFLSAQ